MAQVRLLVEGLDTEHRAVEVREGDGPWEVRRQCEWCDKYDGQPLRGGRAQVRIRAPGPSEDRRDEQGTQYDSIPLCQFCRAVLARSSRRIVRYMYGGLGIVRDRGPWVPEPREPRKQCEGCGRWSGNSVKEHSAQRVIVKKARNGSELCQFCRGSLGRHITTVERLGGTCTVAGRPI